MVTLIKSPALTNAYALSTVVTPPIGIAYIAGTLRAAGIDSQIIDAVGENPDQLFKLPFCDSYGIGLKCEEIVERIDPSADVIGLSCMFSNTWPFDSRLATAIRARFPRARIVLGGEHATACADYILATCPAVDVVAFGEGEETMRELVTTLRTGGDLGRVAGIAFRRNGAVHTTPRRKRIADIDAIPLPAWDLVPIASYMARGLGHGSMHVRNMPLLATRGCPFECTFCSSPQMWTTKWSARSPGLVVDEMEHWVRTYGAENFDLYDLTAIIRKDWIVAFGNELLRRGLRVTYQLPSGTRSEAIDEEAVDVLYRSGCRNMNYAPETGSPATLKAIKKKVKLPRLLGSLRAAQRRGLSVMVNVILFPQDTRADVRETFKFMVRCAFYGADDITFVPFVPYPGTELYDEMIADGRLPPPSEQYFVDLLTHSDLSAAKSHNPHFSPRQVQMLRLLFLSLFYGLSYVFRPYRFFRNLAHVVRDQPRTRGEKTLLLLAKRTMKLRARVAVPG
jgi:anaerobic magnesium-protoporphyrin IX monomethyl ester cyclase